MATVRHLEKIAVPRQISSTSVDIGGNGGRKPVLTLIEDSHSYGGSCPSLICTLMILNCLFIYLLYLHLPTYLLTLLVVSSPIFELKYSTVGLQFGRMSPTKVADTQKSPPLSAKYF